ncbi:hypothetical protein DHW03_18695 [Pedobacter yonginense]|uniref:SPOR domain-containing protein n=1 Tax=Pedobacter yonginense TaxID=651869 RepID=A0A317EI42_9SPHI|nr:HU-CCDC81 and SPOR domain-containing protein [Pedobacter yonginense]PWS26075.1 hypothetical protein DHW03_18695 [Pedobacter yonginense]
MDILSYLLELLQQSKEVSITGLGTFYKKKFPGRYDKEKQSFLPPGYTLQFTSEVRDAENLVNFIAAKRNISTDSTNHYISRFADDVNKRLEIEHEAELENIGRLFYTEHEGLSFEPAQSVSYGSEFYGLPSIQAADDSAEEVAVPHQKEDEGEIYDEIAEAPVVPSESQKTIESEATFPVIENVELDEVKDDLKNTLKHSGPLEAEAEVPEFIKEQHQENPDRFGHTPESEQGSDEHKGGIIDAPEFIKEQHEEHPNRFGHTPEVEIPKTYINLHDDVVEHEEIVPVEEVIEAPGFIKEQHAEHPERFGHDPLLDETSADESKSIWPKILVGILILAVIGGLLYFIKPELFTPVAKVDQKQAPVAIDSQKVTVDTAKLKQDSIAKTDSILKANQVVPKKDSVKKAALASQKPALSDVMAGNTTFHIIGASFKTVKKAEQFIQQMKGYGISAKIVPIEGPYKKVSIASFKTEKEAFEARPALSKKVRIKELDIKQINTP